MCQFQIIDVEEIPDDIIVKKIVSGPLHHLYRLVVE